MICDNCKSTSIISHDLGDVCTECGFISERLILQYHHPYDEEKSQHSILRGTIIGTKQERRGFLNSYHLNKLNELNNIEENEKGTCNRAWKEINRIFASLQLPCSKRKLVYLTFKDLRSRLTPGTKYRSPEKLIPIIIHYCMKVSNISINAKVLLDCSKINKKDFDHFNLRIPLYFPGYKRRDRKKYILQKIMEVQEHFALDMGFYHKSRQVLYRLWKDIQCTKDDVIAGIACSIVLACYYQDIYGNSITINAICSKLNIMMSTIHSLVRSKIIEKYQINDYISLIKTPSLLRSNLEMMKILS